MNDEKIVLRGNPIDLRIIPDKEVIEVNLKGIVEQLIDQEKISSKEKAIYIYVFEVPFDFRGQGYGKDAINRFLELAHSKDYEYVFCNPLYPPCIDFFEHMGFEQINEKFWGKRV